MVLLRLARQWRRYLRGLLIVGESGNGVGRKDFGNPRPTGGLLGTICEFACFPKALAEKSSIVGSVGGGGSSLPGTGVVDRKAHLIGIARVGRFETAVSDGKLARSANMGIDRILKSRL
jgi:hypothetical protein